MVSTIRPPAELFAGRNRTRKRRMRYRRFDTAAEAIRFAMEEIPAPVLIDVYLQVDDERFGAAQVRELYGNIACPLVGPIDTGRTGASPNGRPSFCSRRHMAKLPATPDV
jgi:hypothetical protein